MTYQGTVQNGVVVFASTAPPDGTHVRVEAVPDAGPAPQTRTSVWQKMSGLVGRAPELPADAAINHDHYLYGRPRR